MPRRTPLVGALAMLVLPACSGADAAAPPTEPTTAEPTAATSPVAETRSPTTTVPVEIVVDTTEAPSAATTAPTVETTKAETTTSEPISEEVQARLDVMEAVVQSFDASVHAVRDPHNDAKLAVLDFYFDGPLLEGWYSVVERYRAEGLIEIENTQDPDSLLVDPASVAVSEDLDAAIVQGCSVTSGIVVEVQGNSDGTGRVVEDGVARTVVEFGLAWTSGRWKVRTVHEPEPSERVATCGG